MTALDQEVKAVKLLGKDEMKFFVVPPDKKAFEESCASPLDYGRGYECIVLLTEDVEFVDQFGQVETIAIGPDNEIYNGHQRLNVLMEEHGGDYKIECRQSDKALSEKEREKLTVFLHKGAAGDWDWDILANEFEYEELIEWGFDEGDLIGWEKEEKEAPEPRIDEAEELREKWGVESGQLWQLGEHRVICGDCTDKAVVDRLMGGKVYSVLVTSPPYSDLRTYEIGEFDWDKLMNGFSELAFDYMEKKSSIIVNLGQKHTKGKVDFYWNKWLEFCEDNGYPLFGLYVWSKSTAVPGDYRGRCMQSHEFIFHFKNGNIQARKWVKCTTDNAREKGHTFRQKSGELKDAGSKDKIGQDYRIPYSVFRAPVQHPTNTADNEHPARYSEEFASQLVLTWSDKGSIVYDPFLGSGTTLIACERLNRKCYGVEIEPKYIAVTIERWHEMTGEEPILLDT